MQLVATSGENAKTAGKLVVNAGRTFFEMSIVIKLRLNSRQVVYIHTFTNRGHKETGSFVVTLSFTPKRSSDDNRNTRQTS